MDYRGAPTVEAPASMPLAGFWIRLAGYLVDGIIFAVVDLILSPFLLTSTTTVSGTVQTTTRTESPLLTLIIVVLEIAYFVYFWTHGGASLGQKLVGVRVVDADTQGPLRTSQALLRYVGYIISGVCILIGFIWVAFDARKQGWMDKIAGTLVVKSR